MTLRLIRRARAGAGIHNHGIEGEQPPSSRSVRSRRLRRAGLVLAAGSVITVGCAGPTIPLQVGLADRPVDLLLGERAAAVAEAPIPPLAIPPAALPDFDLDFPAALPAFDFTATPPTVAVFPSFTSPTTTIPAGCTATPPERKFNDSPDNIMFPPIVTPAGNEGYVTRTSGQIDVGGDKVATTVLPQLTKRRIENLEIHSRYPATAPANQHFTFADNYTMRLDRPSDYSFEVLVDVGKAEHNTRTKYRVVPGYAVLTGTDRYRPASDGTIESLIVDGALDDFFTDFNHNGTVEPLEMYNDINGDRTIQDIERYKDLNGDGTITRQLSTQPTMPTPAERDERYLDVNGDGIIGGWFTSADVTSWRPSALVIDTNNDGVPDQAETRWPNEKFRYASDGRFDFPSIVTTKGGIYLVSMQTGKQSPVVFSKVKDDLGALVDAPGARLAELPFTETAGINTRAYDATGKTAIEFESTVFGRHDVDVCRTDIVTWKIELEEGRLFGENQALDFTAAYAIGSQYGGIFLEEKSTVTSIQAGEPPVRRVVETVFTIEPPAGADPADSA